MLSAILIFIAAFVTIIAIVWAGVQLMQPQEDSIGDRLAELRGGGGAVPMSGGGGSTKRKARGFTGQVVNVVSSIPGGDDWVKGNEKRLRYAGIRGEQALGNYVTFAVGFFLLCMGGMAYGQRNNDLSNAFGGFVAAGIIGFIGPQFVLGKMATNRRKRMQEGLPDTIDMLGIVLGTGLALDQAMTRVSAEMEFIYPDLASEFSTVTMQVRAGQERAKAFKGMERRTGLEDIKSLSAMIIQSERFGTPLSTALNAFAKDLRDKRKLRAEEAVGKAGIKMLFPIMLFILPALFVVALVPGLLSALRDLRGGIGAK